MTSQPGRYHFGVGGLQGVQGTRDIHRSWRGHRKGGKETSRESLTSCGLAPVKSACEVLSPPWPGVVGSEAEPAHLCFLQWIHLKKKKPTFLIEQIKGLCPPLDLSLIIWIPKDKDDHFVSTMLSRYHKDVTEGSLSKLQKCGKVEN